MTTERNVAEIPATERAVVGLCHDLNDQLAAVSAYAFLLDRRGALGDMGAQIHEHLDQLAHCVRLVRSLCRNPDPEVGPVAISLMAEALTDTMKAHPDGPIRFELSERNGSEGPVVRCDWARALRTIVELASWARRDMDPADPATVMLSAGPEPNSIRVRMAPDAPEPVTEAGPPVESEDATVTVLGPREVVARFS